MVGNGSVIRRVCGTWVAAGGQSQCSGFGSAALLCTLSAKPRCWIAFRAPCGCHTRFQIAVRRFHKTINSLPCAVFRFPFIAKPRCRDAFRTRPLHNPAARACFRVAVIRFHDTVCLFRITINCLPSRCFRFSVFLSGTQSEKTCESRKRRHH